MIDSSLQEVTETTEQAPESNKDTSPLNLVRAIFLGNSSTGKTSLIRKLNGEAVLEGKEGITKGVDISEWAVTNSPIKAKFWDFGGQVNTHSMHQSFLRARCLYIVVLAAGSENQSSKDQAEYWLEHIQSFANSASVLLVGNKVDQANIDIDREALSEKYSNIIGFYPLSCTSKDAELEKDFAQFTTVLIEQLKAVGTHQIQFSQNDFFALEKIRKLSRNNAFLDQEQFDTVCAEYDIGKQGLDKTAFLNLLDTLGEIVHFAPLKWDEACAFNPRWLTYGIYSLLHSDKIVSQNGVLRHADVVQILQAEKIVDEEGNQINYPKEKYRFISDAIKQLKLRYQLPISGSFYAMPDLFPKEQPNLKGYFDKDDEGILAFEYRFSHFLPRSIMPNIIVVLHDDIAQNVQSEELVWQEGVMLESEIYQAKACWTMDYDQGLLKLWVEGKEAQKYSRLLRDEVQKIFSTVTGLVVEENALTLSNRDAVSPQSSVATPDETILQETDKDVMEALAKLLVNIKRLVEKTDADFFVKTSAYGDLQRIEMYLGLEKLSSVSKNTLQLLLNGIEDGSLDIIKLLEETKGADKTIVELKQKAAAVNVIITVS
ncbi:MAG TPA: hypothetical protein EYG68_06300 [Leucothrix mucor]|nr:hypothetical protein [Leucothrix mucor]